MRGEDYQHLPPRMDYMLYNGNCWLIKFSNKFVGSIRIIYIVIR